MNAFTFKYFSKLTTMTTTPILVTTESDQADGADFKMRSVVDSPDHQTDTVNNAFPSGDPREQKSLTT